MNFSVSSILAGLLFSAVGLWLFREGRRRHNIPVVVIAVLLMGYTFFTKSALADWGLGALLCGGAYWFWA